MKYLLRYAMVPLVDFVRVRELLPRTANIGRLLGRWNAGGYRASGEPR
jgi:hypothetical protein